MKLLEWTSWWKRNCGDFARTSKTKDFWWCSWAGLFCRHDICFLGKRDWKMERRKDALALWFVWRRLPEKSREDENSLGEVFKKGEFLATKKQLIANLRKFGTRKCQKITKGWFFGTFERANPARNLICVFGWRLLSFDPWSAKLNLGKSSIWCDCCGWWLRKSGFAGRFESGWRMGEKAQFEGESRSNFGDFQKTIKTFKKLLRSC